MRPLWQRYVIAIVLWLGVISTLYWAYSDMKRTIQSLEKVTYEPSKR